MERRAQEKLELEKQIISLISIISIISIIRIMSIINVSITVIIIIICTIDIDIIIISINNSTRLGEARARDKYNIYYSIFKLYHILT